ncbi:MAG: ABC transporter permease [Candidatus Methanoperedens sp.]|nr:ABC transporter permease [Candidatus Methanoperedens sp.]MCZ7370050.1 ABC transporter permease [Candidatus Methanoperedens sp.]
MIELDLKKEIRKSWIIMIKEFRQILRKKAFMIPMFMFPIVMIVFFGYGMGGTIKNADILVINDDIGTASSSLVQEIGSFIPKYGDPRMFSITYTKDMSQSEAERKIDGGLYKAVLIIPPDYSERVAKNENVTLTLLTDSSDTTSSGIIINFMKQLFAGTSGSLVSLNIPDIYGKLEYIDFLTPAVIALTVFFGTIQTMGYAIAGERQDGTLVRIMMTPVSRGAIILGKTLHQLVLQLARAVVLILGAIVLLGVTMNGSWLLVALVLIIFTFGAVGLGMAISAISEDMISFQAISMLVAFPSMFATGVFYPLGSAPDWMRWIAYMVPLTYANDAMRTIMIKGQGLAFIANDLIILIFFAILYFALGVYLFRREA